MENDTSICSDTALRVLGPYLQTLARAIVHDLNFKHSVNVGIEEASRAGKAPGEILDCLYVMEHVMDYFFFKAKGMRAVGNHDKAERYYLRALTAAEKIAPYKYARLSAVKVMGDPNAQKDFEDGATLEELKAMVEFHLERVAPMLDLEVIPKARIANQPVGVDQSANGK
jgi:sulfur carrier protein ThiS